MCKLRDNGDGAEMFRREHFCSRQNICACKKLNPVPFCPNAFLIGRVGGDTLVTDSLTERV